MSIPSRLSALLGSLARSPQARRLGRDLLRGAADQLDPSTRSRRRPTGEGPARRSPRRPGSDVRDGSGALTDRASHPPLALGFAPVDDDRADPGEVVWAWVPFEEDIERGKDRPVLVIAREDASVGGPDGSGTVLVALMLTSHDRGRGTHVDERGSTWVDVGTGTWDSRGRPSEVRADRLLRIPIDAVRREGARLHRDRFERVVDAVREVHGWDR